MDLRHGDLFDVLPTLPANSVDACVLDSPYGLAFMGQEWDKPRVMAEEARERERVKDDHRATTALRGWHGRSTTASENRDYQQWCEQWGAAVLRVLKPGAWLASFGATRLWHRMVCGLEDAGFEVRDGIAFPHAFWAYGSGFPKSKNDGPRGTALKPAWEPIALLQRPREGTYAECYERYGTGYLNIDDARVPLNGEHWDAHDVAAPKSGSGLALGNYTKYNRNPGSHEQGRWPANLCHDGSHEVLAEFPHTSSEVARVVANNRNGDGSIFGFGGGGRKHPSDGQTARFFYCSKPSAGEKEAGLDALPLTPMHEVQGRENGSAGSENPRAGVRGNARRMTHPTCKPIELMRWLIRLCCPPGGLVLDPFLGSGTTAIAAHLEGRECVGIEREAEYMAIARARTDWWRRNSTRGQSVAAVLGDVGKPAVASAGQQALDL